MQLANQLKQSNPQALYEQMYAQNPQFRSFIDENKDLSINDIAQKYGIPIK